jgi:hypothetical protein
LGSVRNVEDLGFELLDEEFYRVLFRHAEIGEFDVEALRLKSVWVP